jgi:CRP-like cAMP-binding protein
MDRLVNIYEDRLIAKLERLGPLSEDERHLLQDLPRTETSFPTRHDLFREGEPPPHCMVLLEGLVCRCKGIGDGRRQIVAFNIPGDILGLASILLGRMDHSIGALTPVHVAIIPNAAMLALTERCPNLTRLLWRETLIEAAVFREWVLNLGRRSAYERTAHLLCEISSRLHAIGLSRGHSYPLPITQAELADALGLTPVHVNRTLQHLRANGLIEWRHRMLVVRNWPALKEAAGFDPAYLYELAAAA